MIVLFLGDPHIRVDNLPEIDEFITKVLLLIEERKPDLICIGGDLLHTHERLHTTPLNKAFEMVRKLRVHAPVVILVGNHDMLNNSQFLTDGHWMTSMKEWDRVTIADKVVDMVIEGKTLLFVPYVPPGRFIEALSTCSTDYKTVDCIFAHQEFYGCKMGAIVSVEGDRWEEKYPLVVSGHIHSSQWIGKNIFYSGSSLQNAFGESEKNIVSLVSFDRDFPSIEEVDLGLARKKIIYTKVEDISDLKLDDADNKIKISISGVYDEFKAFKKTQKYKELVKKGTKVVFKPKRIEKIESKEKKIEGDFKEVLADLIYREKNSYLAQVYEEIVNSNPIKVDDIFFV